jgi:hypothetical protein
MQGEGKGLANQRAFGLAVVPVEPPVGMGRQGRMNAARVHDRPGGADRRLPGLVKGERIEAIDVAEHRLDHGGQTGMHRRCTNVPLLKFSTHDVAELPVRPPSRMTASRRLIPLAQKKGIIITQHL